MCLYISKILYYLCSLVIKYMNNIQYAFPFDGSIEDGTLNIAFRTIFIPKSLGLGHNHSIG